MLRKSILICIVTSFCFTSCAVKLKEEFVLGYSNLSFSSLKKYADVGFLITPSEAYGANYNSIGFMTIEKMLDAEAKIVEVLVPIPGSNQTTTEKKRRWNAPDVPRKGTDAMVEILYQKALSQGADAIINFKVERISRSFEYPMKVQWGYRVSGFAIDRLD